MGKLFGTDGIRGVAGELISAELALKLGRAVGTYLKKKEKSATVLIATDTRISSDMILSALSSGLCDTGADAYLLGVAPTPAVSYLLEDGNFGCGIVISASHNPYYYNGLKILDENGIKLRDNDENFIENMLLSDEAFPTAKGGEFGRIYESSRLLDKYVYHLKSCASISLSGLKIGIDASNGAAYKIAADVFSSLGAECKIINADPDGININEECGSTNMKALGLTVRDNALDCAVAFDGDADRCLAIDELGREVDGDEILAILASVMKAHGRLRADTVVGTVMSNCGLEKFLAASGISFIRTAVGDKYISEKMKSEGYSLGGESSGHIIIADNARTGDGMLTAISLLCAVKDSKKTLSELKSVMKKYPQITVNIPASQREKDALASSEEIKRAITAAKKALGGGRILVRPSGTEPNIRVMAEGENEIQTEQIAEALARRINTVLKKSGG